MDIKAELDKIDLKYRGVYLEKMKPMFEAHHTDIHERLDDLELKLDFIIEELMELSKSPDM